jgi:anti-anti-sigma regulatory factor
MPRPPAEPRIEVHWEPGEALVIVRSDLDGASAAALCERLAEIDGVLAVLNGQPRRLIVDLAGVRFADRVTLDALAATRGRLQPGCHLLLRSPGWGMHQALASPGLDGDCVLDGQVAGGTGRSQAQRPVRRRQSPR